MAKPNGGVPDELAIYAFAHTESWLESYAKTHAIPVVNLTARVVEMLSSQIAAFDFDHVSQVSAASLRHGRRDTRMGEVALSRDARTALQSAFRNGATPEVDGERKRVMTAEGRANIAAAQRRRWKLAKKAKRTTKGYSYNGKHWTQTPAGRKRMAAIRQAHFAK